MIEIICAILSIIGAIVSGIFGGINLYVHFTTKKQIQKNKGSFTNIQIGDIKTDDKSNSKR